MNGWSIAVLTAIVGALVSGVATYVGTRNKMRFDYDADLRQKRIEAYLDLWSRLEPLARYARSAPMSGEDVDRLADSLRAWYFRTGGLFLSTTTRREYFALQDLLAKLSTGWGWESADRRLLTPPVWHLVRTHGSRLRTGLTRDVGTRAQPRLPGNVEPVDRSLAGQFEAGDGQLLRLRFRPRLLGGGPRLTLHGPDAATERVAVKSWRPMWLTMRVRLGGRQSLLILEPEQLIEAPLPEDDGQSLPILWKRS